MIGEIIAYSAAATKAQADAAFHRETPARRAGNFVAVTGRCCRIDRQSAERGYSKCPLKRRIVIEQPNGLALEYQREYGRASRNLDVSDLINNPAANGVCRVFGLRLKKELVDGGLIELGALMDDAPNPLLVRLDAL